MSSRNISRCWCFTINNFDAAFLRPSSLPSGCKYIIFGKERGESGTHHLQGFVQFFTEKSLRQVVDFLKCVDPVTAHVEITKGSCFQASEYCKKEADYVEFGQKPLTAQEKGAASKKIFCDVIASAEKGDLADVKERYPNIYVSHYNTLQRICADSLVRPPDLSQPQCIWLFGPPGVGKSHLARGLGCDYFDKALNKWWDGYGSQRVVIIEEVNQDSSKCLSNHFKRWFDKYAFTAEVKGGTRWIRPEWIIITSNYSLEECFGCDAVLLAAISRRVSFVSLSLDNRLLQCERIRSLINPSESPEVVAPDGDL